MQAEGNLYRHMQGHWDGDVTPVGRQQRNFLALRFKDIPVDAVYSSDLYRARFTASAITKFHDLPIQCDRRLREINIGPWEAAPFANVRREQPELFDAFIHDPAHFCMPGAETYHDVQARVIDALQEIAEKNPNRTVVITTHGVAIDKSRMNREVHVRFRESLRVKVLLATRLRGRGLFSPSYSIISIKADAFRNGRRNLRIWSFRASHERHPFFQIHGQLRRGFLLAK
ncbi:MAG: histidine phosphatase family protein [Oscillospiraceae bacterium]|nr:histidine phosphatase family protein [Oscillospiraceae bacterium]